MTTVSPTALFHAAAALFLCPLLPGIINRTKAVFAGRKGQPLLQAYHDLFKLLRKGAVYSRTTGWVFRAGPVAGLAALFTALFLMPAGGGGAFLSFNGDLVLFCYLFGIVRFFTVAAALDTGSAFEGMGASREVQFSVLAEPALLLGLAALAGATGAWSDAGQASGHALSLSGIYAGLSMEVWVKEGTALLLTAAALLVVLLAECARIPVDDPSTHLELTMIHEVMVLDHGGPDFGMIVYGSALKLWMLSGLLAGLLVPVRSGNAILDTAVFLVGIGAVAVAVGVIESTMARLRLLRVPQLLTGAGVLSVLALVLVLRG